VVFAWDPDSALLRPLVETASEVPEPAVAAGDGAIGRCFATRQPVIVDDYQAWDRALPVSASRGMRSAIAVPLVSDDRAIGALGVWTYEARAFGDPEARLLSLLAAQLARFRVFIGDREGAGLSLSGQTVVALLLRAPFLVVVVGAAAVAAGLRALG